MGQHVRHHQPLRRNLVAASIATILGCVSQLSVAASGDETQLEVIEVRGINASKKQDLNNKRFHDGVMDSITAEDIGKLPDVTIADTLQRIPGVQIRRSAGEGSTINVRGMPQVTTLLNGEQFLSAGAITQVQPDFTDIPAALISGINVLKSPAASTLAGGISGTLDLKTRKPFDLTEGYTFSLNAEGTRGSLSQENDPKIAAFAGYQKDDFGIIVTAAYDSNTLANYRNGTILNSTEVISENSRDFRDINQDGDLNDSFYSQRFYGIMDRETERDRLGLSTTVQYRFSDALLFTGDLFYTDMDDADRKQGVMVDNARGPNWAYSDQFIPRLANDSGGQIYTANNMNLKVRRVSAYSESLTNDRQSTNLSLMLEFAGDGAWSGTARYLHGSAERGHTENVAHGYLTSGAQHGLLKNNGDGPTPVNPNGYGPDPVDVSFSRGGDYIQLGFAPGFGSDINKYNLVSTYSENNFEEEATLDVLRFDGKYDFALQHLQNAEFGVRVGKRDVERETYILVAPFTSGNFSADVMWKDSGASLGDTNGDGKNSVADGDLTIGQPHYFADLPEGWVQQVNGLGPGGDDLQFYLINPKVMDDPFAFQNALYPGNKKLANPERTYQVKEQTQTAYMQFNFAGTIAGLDYNANLGAQYVRTELDMLQNQLGSSRPCSLCTASEKTGEKWLDRSYSDFLPTANFNLNLTDELILRASAGKTMTNLDIGKLAGGISVGRTRAGDVLAAELGVSPDLLVAVQGTQNGNPDLEPWRANNYNLALEWYFSQSGLLSITAFKMDIESFIERGTVMLGLPDIDGVVRREVPVATEVNGEGGKIDGFELTYQQAFDFLPAPFDGLGMALNFTYAPSDSANVDVYGDTLPIQDNSEKSANAVLWYEKDALQLRLAANYRSDRLDSLSSALGKGVVPFWTASTLYYDLYAGYEFAKDSSVYLSVSNLTEEKEDIYAQWSDNVITQNIFERRVTLGVRTRF
ncbi:TonB-dependent receptor [Pseudoalteromonas fenneropenaei]|uniref:TonB-dependent receptor n=1 Tax=Pseudoalteromonas fenneropenaei TaxID=1737459 RepID=A0ABV7CJ78_9GAMM